MPATARRAARRASSAPVRVANAEQRDMAVVEHTIGTVVANSTVSVTARVQGQLTKAYFKEGQLVKKGDLLFQIDPRPYQAAYDNAVATLAAAKSKADRYQRLSMQNAISPQSNDNAQAAYLQAKANAEAARLNLEFTRSARRSNGKTGPILLQPGNLVSVNGMTAPLVTITQIQPIKVSFTLPQSDLPRIQARAAARRPDGRRSICMTSAAQDLTAPVDFISNAVSDSAAPSNCAPPSPTRTPPWCPASWWMWWSQLANIPERHGGAARRGQSAAPTASMSMS